MENHNNLRSARILIQTKRPALRYRAVKRGVPALAATGGIVAVQSYEATRRDYKKIIGVVFLAVLLILIFFSKTIYGYNLPVITAVKPENSRLSKLEISSGIVDWAEVENLYAAVGGKVDEVLVKEGDAVVKNQPLYRLSFDRDEAERKLREIQNSRGKLQTDIQNISLKLEKQNRYMSELASETYEQEKVSEYELDAILIDIYKARLEWRDAEDHGSELEADRASYTLQSLYLKKDELERKLAEQREKVKEDVKEKEKNRQFKLADYQTDIASLKLELQAKNIELNNLSIQEEPYRKALEEFDAYTVITAPIDGTVISLGVKKGEAIRADQLVASIGAADSYEIECAVSLENNFVIPGDVVKLSNSSHTLEGTVTKITPAAQSKLVTIAIESDEISAGETFDAYFQKDSSTTYTLVPNGALNQDNDGYFLNQVKRRDGMLGKEYYLERLDVYIGDSDSKNTAIISGITFFEPVALISDKPVTAGDVVSLSNEGDFFEK